MFFIAGTGNKSKNMGTFPTNCHSCGNRLDSTMICNYNYFHVFFIPLIKFNKEYLVICPCGSIIDRMKNLPK